MEQMKCAHRQYTKEQKRISEERERENGRMGKWMLNIMQGNYIHSICVSFMDKAADSNWGPCKPKSSLSNYIIRFAWKWKHI